MCKIIFQIVSQILFNTLIKPLNITSNLVSKELLSIIKPIKTVLQILPKPKYTVLFYILINADIN